MKPYNRVINELIGGNFPSGCVTTAIAQVMAFHEYPSFYVGYAHKDFRYFKNEIKIFPELIPETRLNFDLFFNWYPL